MPKAQAQGSTGRADRSISTSMSVSPAGHEARGQRSGGCGKSMSAAAELCSGVETSQLRRESTPEAEAEHQHTLRPSL